ncbi:hypothetical protein C1X05_05420 [Laceyella sacchari]|nr:hypothetical protein C1X05_05420 [Laceyella sacchari]
MDEVAKGRKSISDFIVSCIVASVNSKKVGKLPNWIKLLQYRSVMMKLERVLLGIVWLCLREDKKPCHVVVKDGVTGLQFI